VTTVVRTIMILYVTCPILISSFYTHTATTKIYTLSLHDALPIFRRVRERTRSIHGSKKLKSDLIEELNERIAIREGNWSRAATVDRKSTRLNSSHVKISYAVFCLKKKKQSNKYKNTNTYTVKCNC